MKTNNEQIKMGSILTYVQMFIGIIISLLYTPIMLKLLGKSEYGLYNTVTSVISVLSLLSLGLNSGYIRYYSKYKKAEDNDSIWKLNGLFLTVFVIIGIVALACGLFLSFNLEYVFSTGLSADEYNLAKTLMILLSINLAISFPMSVFANIVSANEKFIFIKTISIVKTLLSPLITLPLLLLGWRSVMMVLVSGIVTIAVDIMYLYYVLVKLNNRFVFHSFEKGLLGEIFVYTSFIAINLFVDQINWNVDKVLLGRFKGTSAVAVYSVGYTLYEYYMMFSTSICSLFTPRIHKIVNEFDRDANELKNRLTDLFVKVGRVQFILLGLVATGFVFFGKEFITKHWATAEYQDAYYVALLLMIPASVALIQNLGIEIQRAQNKHKFRAVVYFIMALVNLGISILLCPKYGAIGCAVGTSVSLIVANGIIMNTYYNKCCNIDILRFWKSISNLSLVLIIPIIAGVLIKMFVNPTNIVTYFICILSYACIYCASMWFLGMKEYEKVLFSKPIKKVVKKLFG